MPRLVSQSQFARRKKVDRSTVCKWVKEGKIKLIGGKVDPVEAEKDLANNLIPKSLDSTKPKRKHRKKISPAQSTMEGVLLNGEPTLTEARRQNELLKGELLALKLQLQRGDLVPKGEGLRIVFIQAVAAKSAFWSLPSRLCNTLAVMNDAREIHILLRNEIRLILNTMVAVCSSDEQEKFDRVEGPDAEWEEQLGKARYEGASKTFREEVTSA